jgi:hypothetical protein
MNTKRIIAGGLLAGLVINIGETILNVPIIGAEFDAALQSLGAPAMSGATIGLFVVMCFLLGILAVWLYAAVRPRLGPGPKTAFTVGLVVYLLGYVFPNVGMIAMGIFPSRLIVISLVWALFEVPLAVLAGAWVYKEEPAGA